jgi:hypothetical protein
MISLNVSTPSSATFNVTRYGAFTANFKTLPPPVPAEYWVPLYGVIISSIVGWSIPSIIGWIKAKKEGKRVNQYYKRINSLYDDGKLDENDIIDLDRLKRGITDAYSKGKITDQHYNNLKNETSTLYEEIYKNKIDSSLNNNSKSTATDNDDNLKLLEIIKSDVTDAYSKGKINELHYNLLKEKISNYKNSN